MATILPVEASQSTYDRIDGVVTVNGTPNPGLTVDAYRLTEDEGRTLLATPVLEGTVVTDEDGAFRIDRLYAHSNLYAVIVVNGTVTLNQTVVVPCGDPAFVELKYTSPVTSLTLGFPLQFIAFGCCIGFPLILLLHRRRTRTI